MKLNTENADIIRDYYLNIEEAVLEYTDYFINYMVKKQEIELNYTMKQLAIKDKAEEELKEQLTIKNEQLAIKDKSEETLKEQLAIKDKSEEELKEKLEQAQKLERESKEKLQRALKFNQATKQVEPEEYIYIVTTDRYVPENKYKPGGCENFKLLKSRLNTYNSGKSDSDAHYFVYIKKVVSFRAVEQSLLGCLGGFRENINKELYIIHFDWIVRCLDAIIDHTSDFLNFVNLNRNQMVDDTMNKQPAIPAPVRLEKIRVSYQCIGEDEIEITTIFDQNTIDIIKDSLTSFNPDDNTIKRAIFEDYLKQHHPEVKIDNKKRPLWEIVKHLGSSINPLWRFKY